MVRSKHVRALACAAALSVPASAFAQAVRSGDTFSLGGTTSPVEQPDVAYDSTNNRYLQVAGKVFIEAHLLNATGGIIRTFNVTDSGLYAQNPRVAFSPDIAGGGGYLVTWHASVGDIGRVRGRIFNANGDAVTGEFDIATNATTVQLSTQWTMGAPAAYSTVSDEFLVVWGGAKFATADIFAHRVSNTGALLGAPILISAGTAALYDRDPSVAYSPVTNKFLVGWGIYNEAGRFGYSSARTVDAGSGALGNQVDLGSAVGVSITSIAYNRTHDQFLFAWHNQTSWSPNLHYGQLFNSSGAPIGSIKVVSGYYGTYDALDVEFNSFAGEYLLITHGHNHEDAGVTVKVDGSAYDNGFLATSTTGVNGNFHPRLATSTTDKKWLVVTSSQFARTSGQFLTSNSTGTGTPPPEEQPACTISFSASSATFGAAGGGGGFTLTTGASCAWTAGKNVSWIELSSSSVSGTGTKTLSYTVLANTSNASRSGIIYSGSRSLTVSQAGRDSRTADFNGDGLNDLIWQNRATGGIALWRMHGIRMLSGDYLVPGNVGDTNWKIVGTLDADRDGYTDLLFQHDSGYVAAWRMAGDTKVQGIDFNDSVVGDPSWRVVGTGDMDRDGFSDIIWQHGDGRVAVWYLQGSGFQLRESAIIATVSDSRWRVAAIADFNHDGRLDILWRHSTWGQLLAWYMDNSRFVGSGVNLIMSNPQWHVAAASDFSGDGKPDLIWQNTVTGELAVWFMSDGNFLNAWSVDPGRVADTNWRIVGPR